jgi:hypothetical protein
MGGTKHKGQGHKCTNRDNGYGFSKLESEKFVVMVVIVGGGSGE